jgi:hypothetical protein
VRYFSDIELIVFTIALSGAGPVICRTVGGLVARIVDRKMPAVTLAVARLATLLATRVSHEADRVLHNFESDVYEALHQRHRYTAVMTAVHSLVVVVPRAAFRNGRRAAPGRTREGLLDETWLVANDPMAIIAVQISPLTLVGFAVGYLVSYYGTRRRIARSR